MYVFKIISIEVVIRSLILPSLKIGDFQNRQQGTFLSLVSKKSISPRDTTQSYQNVKENICLSFFVSQRDLGLRDSMQKHTHTLQETHKNTLLKINHKM